MKTLRAELERQREEELVRVRHLVRDEVERARLEAIVDEHGAPFGFVSRAYAALADVERVAFLCTNARETARTTVHTLEDVAEWALQDALRDAEAALPVKRLRLPELLAVVALAGAQPGGTYLGHVPELDLRGPAPRDPKVCRHSTYGRSRKDCGRVVDTCLCGARRINGGEWEGGRS